MSIRVEVADTTEVIRDIWLGDDGPFDFYPPKMGGLMNVALFDGPADEREMEATRATATWVRDGFSEEDWEHIKARLDDPGDPLDWAHLVALSHQIQEAMAARPTTSSRVSSTQRRRTPTGAARQRPQASTSGDSASDDSAT